MKLGRDKDQKAHRVALSDAAVATLLRAYNQSTGTAATIDALPKLAALQGNSLIFPSRKPKTQLSDMALSEVVRRMNEDRPENTPEPWRDADGRCAVPHGFRSSFRTWVDDIRPADASAAECALAHEEENKVTASYRHSDMLDRRIPLMQAWGEHCLGGSSKAQSSDNASTVYVLEKTNRSRKLAAQ